MEVEVDVEVEVEVEVVVIVYHVHGLKCKFFSHFLGCFRLP